MTEPETLHCATHADVETTLRCGKCEKPICPRCLVMTPVGARCKECAAARKLPTFQLSGLNYLVAGLVALGMGLGVGLVWGLIEWLLPSYLFSILLAAGAGWLIAEVIGRAVNRKRGTWLGIIGGLTVLLAYGIVFFIESNNTGYLNVGLMRLGFSFLSAGVGVFIAVHRLR
jgi:hypothetical protein